MRSMCTKFLASGSVVAWSYRTWLPILNPEPIALQYIQNQADHDRCAMGEALVAMVHFLQKLPPDQQTMIEIENILSPLLRRLCEHKKAEGLSGVERTKAMEAVRQVFLGQDLKDDPISQVMYGLKPQTKNAPNGGK
eukprot:PhF_6_TR36334/c0_g1_i1/m.53213